MDITQFEYFKVIAETESLTKAAKELHISQPAMSAMLKKFEEELNVELFDRSPNKIKLNKMGEVALIHTNNILKNVEKMKSDLLSLSNQNLSLSIGFCDPGVQWFSIPRFSYLYPEIKVKDELYKDEDVSNLLIERVYDIIITPEKINHPDINSTEFIKDTVYLSVTSDNKLANRKSISLREIPAQPLLVPDIGGYFIEQIENIIKNENPKVNLIKNDFLIIQHLIRSTNFLTTISSLSKELRNDGENRVLVPFSDKELNKTYFVSYTKRNKNKVNSFLQWAKTLIV